MVRSGSYGLVEWIGLWSCLVSSIFQAPLYLQSSWCCCIYKVLVAFFDLHFSELSVVGLSVDLVD